MKTKLFFTLVFVLGLIFNSLAQKDGIYQVHDNIKNKAKGKKDTIVFFHNPSSEVFAMSKKQDKLIFVDIYTTWCGPCKRMSAQTFKDASVAKVYNENFICYKLDAEQGEGIEFAKKYSVKAYPTYLFLDENGKLVYQSLGYQEPASFIEEANKALQAAGKKK